MHLTDEEVFEVNCMHPQRQPAGPQETKTVGTEIHTEYDDIVKQRVATKLADGEFFPRCGRLLCPPPFFLGGGRR